MELSLLDLARPGLSKISVWDPTVLGRPPLSSSQSDLMTWSYHLDKSHQCEPGRGQRGGLLVSPAGQEGAAPWGQGRNSEGRERSCVLSRQWRLSTLIWFQTSAGWAGCCSATPLNVYRLHRPPPVTGSRVPLRDAALPAAWEGNRAPAQGGGQGHPGTCLAGKI